MVNKTKVFYDILTGILVLWIIVAIFVFSFGGTTINPLFIMILSIGSVIYAYIYSVAMIVLVIMKQKGGNLSAMIFGSIIIPGLLPLIYYLFFIRKQLNNQNELPTTV